MKIRGCSRTSLMEWWSKYRHEGGSGLDDHRLGGNSAKLSVAQVTDLAQRLQIYSPRQLFGRQGGSPVGQFWTVPELQRAVKEGATKSEACWQIYKRDFGGTLAQKLNRLLASSSEDIPGGGKPTPEAKEETVP
jgi:transposase